MITKKFCSVFILLLLAGCQASRAQFYTGHDGVAQLRGFNVGAGNTSSQFPALTSFGANVVRYEISYSDDFPGYSGPTNDAAGDTAYDMDGGTSDISSADLENYHNWLSWEVSSSSSDLNTCLSYCAAHNIKVLIDDHYPAGGGLTSGPDRIFAYGDCEQEFLSDWTLIAQTYAGNAAVWGYDICNEPNDAATSSYSTVANWNNLVLQAAEDIRQVDSAGGSDPQHALIVEPAGEGFPGLTPLTSVAGVVYSFHTYGDEIYSFYGWDPDWPAGSRVWPDTSYYDGSTNYDFNRHDVTQVYSYVAQARAFQLANNCQMFVGEFDCVRWAPGSAEWLNEFISLFDQYGWDWTFLNFRAIGFNGWDAEVGPSTGPNDDYVQQVNAPFLPKTDMKTVLASYFASNADSVPDFNFSSPVQQPKGASYAPSGAAWIFNSQAGLAANGSGLSNPGTGPVGQCAFLQSSSAGVGTISQTLTWLPNTDYVVTFRGANRSLSNVQTVQVYIGGTVGSNGNLSGGTLVGKVTPSTTAWDSYETPVFMVGSGSIPFSAALSFVGTSTTGTHTAFLSDVTISTPNPSMLPLGNQWLTGAHIDDGSGAPTAANSAVAATDGNVNTYYSSKLASGGWTGIDLGSGNAATVSHVYFYPRSDNTTADYAASMDGGVFQGSNDESTWTTLATVNNEGPQWGQLTGARTHQWCQFPVVGAKPYRYFRYYGPANSNCNVAEIRWYGNKSGYIDDGSESGLTTPAQEAFDGNSATSFESQLSSGGWCGIDLGSGSQGAVYQVSYYPDSTPSKMVGGVFQGSNNKTSWTNLCSAIESAPNAGQWTTIITTPETAPYPNPYPKPYRYFRYYNAGSGNSGVSDIQFYGDESHQLSGTNINDAHGTTWSNPPTNAYDGSATTCYDSNLGKGGWTGLDFGAGIPRIITSIKFYPDSSWSGGPSQMIGGVFQGSNDQSTWTNLTTQLTAAPKISAWTTVTSLSNVPYRYVRYYDNGSGSNYCNIAEAEYFGY